MAIQDDSSVALIPSAYGTSKVYSVIPSNGNGDFTFSRSGNATRVNKGGFIETMGTNVPRLDYPLIDGVVQDCPALLLEPSRTNYLERTEEFSNSYWTKYNSSVSANQTVSPDGAVTADKLIENTVNTQHEMGRAFGFTSGITYVVSVFAKSNGRNLQIRGGNTATFPANANFDLSNGTIQSTSLGTAYIEDYGNGWYRCMVKATAAASSSTNINFRLVKGTISTYAGDNSSGVFFWGAQNEIGLYPTSYISWDGSGTTTRSVDACNGSGTSAEFNDSEGVLFAEMAALGTDGITKRLAISNSSNSYIVRLEFRPTVNQIYGVVFLSPSNMAVLTHTVSDWTQFNKVAVKYKQNDFAMWINGVEVSTDSLGSTGTGLDDFSFDAGNGGNDWYGKSKQLMTFKTALNDSELETLTSWDSFNAMATGQLYTIE
jgi:hypothetical protein